MLCLPVPHSSQTSDNTNHYRRLGAEVIASHNVQYHHHAYDMQVRPAMHANNTTAAARLSVLAASIADVGQWYMQNGPQLNQDKSEAMIVRMAHKLCAATSTASSIMLLTSICASQWNEGTQIGT